MEINTENEINKIIQRNDAAYIYSGGMTNDGRLSYEQCQDITLLMAIRAGFFEKDTAENFLWYMINRKNPVTPLLKDQDPEALIRNMFETYHSLFIKKQLHEAKIKHKRAR